MRHRTLRTAVLVCWITSLAVVTSLGQQPASGSSDTAKAFRRQYAGLVKGYVDGNSKQIQSAFDEFAIPASWFNDMFGTEQGQRLFRRYVSEFEYFAYQTRQRLRQVTNELPSCLKTKPSGSKDGLNLKPAPVSAPASAQVLPPVQMYVISCSGMSWMDSFVYLGGAYRFFGGGAYPFWDPMHIEMHDPCSADFTQPGGRLVRRVAPDYPEPARKEHAKGIVRLLITVGKDGSVMNAEILDGHPLLHDAARAAVLQWRYEPFMNCGEPAEITIRGHVEF